MPASIAAGWSLAGCVAGCVAAYVAAYGAALLLTLCACAWLTPRAWWQRPTARALALLGAGTGAGGMLLLTLFGAPGIPDTPETPAASAHAGRIEAPALAPGFELPVAGSRYRVRAALNLRMGGGIGAERLLVVPGGTLVLATGRHEGDWWQVRARLDGRQVEGWASSLWLRRADER